ncbi:MAG: HEAT repeat domain-containing protein [Candidatus Aminicenantales bacterium]
MRKLHIAVSLVVAAAGLLVLSGADRYRPPSQVLDRSAASGPLATKIDRALAEAPKAASGQAFWVGYAIDRLMGENSHIGSFDSSRGSRDIPIRDILAGKTGPALTENAPGDLHKAASAALDKIERKGQPEKKVLKELGFFLKYGPGTTPVLTEVKMSNLELSFDFEGEPLFWLGKAPEDQSLAFVEALYGRNRGGDVRENLIAAAGCHGSPKLALPFLEGVLSSSDPDGLRKDAAFWISQLNDADGLRLLAKAARADRSEEVREGAVFGISQVELPAAVDELISLARGADKRDVRKQAVFWLGQMASEKSGKVLEEIAIKDGDLEIQEQALFALSELPENGGLDVLIKVAKTHADPRIRKKAVFWLGESDDPRALDAIVAIIKGK